MLSGAFLSATGWTAAVVPYEAVPMHPAQQHRPAPRPQAGGSSLLQMRIGYMPRECPLGKLRNHSGFSVTSQQKDHTVSRPPLPSFLCISSLSLQSKVLEEDMLDGSHIVGAVKSEPGSCTRFETVTLTWQPPSLAISTQTHRTNTPNSATTTNMANTAIANSPDHG